MRVNGVCFGMVKAPPALTAGRPVAGGGDRRAGAPRRPGRERHDLVEAPGVEGVVAVRLEVLGAADAGVGHDRGAAARLIGRRAVAVAAAFGGGAVEGVIAAELVPHLVGHVVDVEAVADRIGLAGDAPRLAARARHVEIGDPAAAGRDDVADVVVGRADHAVEVALVLPQHGGAVAVAVGVGGAVGIDDQVVVADQHHADRHLALIDAVDPVHRHHHGVQGAGDGRRVGSADRGRVLARGGQRQPVGAELGPRGDGQRDRRHVPLGFLLLRARLLDVAVEARPGRLARLVLEIGEDIPRIPAAVGIDEHGARRGQHHGMEAQGGQAQAGGGRGIVDPLGDEGADLGESGRQLGLEDRRLLDAEEPVRAVRVRESEQERLRGGRRRAFGRRPRQQVLERLDVHLQRPEVPRQGDLPGAATGRERLAREVAEEALLREGGNAQGYGESQEDQKFAFGHRNPHRSKYK